MLYETWARRSDPDSQAVLTEAIATIAAELSLAVASAGQAWQRVLAGSAAPVLHDRDGSHPTLAGSWLAAAVIAMTAFPADLDRIAIPDDNPVDAPTAGRLLAAAREVVGQGRAAIPPPMSGPADPNQQTRQERT